MDLLQYGFFQHALLGSLLTAIACGIVGTYIVSRRLVFISGAEYLSLMLLSVDWGWGSISG